MSVDAAQLGLIALGGAFGGIARFWLSSFVASRFAEIFPWGILCVNVTGAVAIGIAAGLMPDHVPGAGAMPSGWHFVVAGLLGSYTTVSSFSLQTLSLFRSGHVFRAALNIIASLVLCLAGAAFGYLAALRIAGG